MSIATPFEQLMLEYVNRARMDPQGEFDRFILSSSPVQAIESNITQALGYFRVDLQVYQQQLAGLAAVAPLAWNSALGSAATAHSQLMIDQDTQSHQLTGEASLESRVSAAGYTNWSRLAENVYAYSESPAFGHAGFFIDWGNGPNGIQSPAGHRNNIMNANLTEVGISVIEDSSGSTSVGPYVTTQDFGARSDYQAQYLGVAYNDSDGNGFYSMGEGIGGLTVTLEPAAGGGALTATQVAGGYSIEAIPGLNTVTFSGTGLSTSVTAKVSIDTQNVKVDLVDGNRIESSADTTLSDGAVDLVLLGQFETAGTGNGMDNILTGSLGDNQLLGLSGHDTLYGGEGDDILKGNGGRDFLYGDSGNDTAFGGVGADTIFMDAGNDIAKGNKGNDFIDGGAGNDTLYGYKHSDNLYGAGGDDDLWGGKGNDNLSGGSGADTLAGGSGADVITGGIGDDILIGGLGDDTFAFEAGFGSDVIEDFHFGEDGIDVIDFSALGIGFTDLTLVRQGTSTLITTPDADSVLLQGVLPVELLDYTDFLF
jgi:Ca2+-binding RTX toxin-like protein